MIRLPLSLRKAMYHAAQNAYPQECCGLLAGIRQGNCITVTQVLPSANLAPTPETAFEVDPQVRFDLMRAVEGTGEEMIGHYHSHPDHPAKPSARDLEKAFEPELIWVIIDVPAGTAETMGAFKLDEGLNQFIEIPITVTDEL
ncbi:MAG: Mov34/MPN/PAD-1 family protein [Magnetospiraceae bacterium]